MSLLEPDELSMVPAAYAYHVSLCSRCYTLSGHYTIWQFLSAFVGWPQTRRVFGHDRFARRSPPEPLEDGTESHEPRADDPDAFTPVSGRGHQKP